MSQNLCFYNGFQFNPYSEISVNAQMQDDDSGRVTLYNRYRVRVETTIYAEELDAPGIAGSTFKRLRDRLSKKGQALVIYHLGFHDEAYDVNLSPSGRRDVTFGPHPRLIAWDPVGEQNAVHVVWECEFMVSACDRWDGLMSLNYSIQTRIDMAGYTTRTVSGHLEIAMTRNGDRIPDTADKYRDRVSIPALPNFQREHHWALSLDKRRADFSIVDTEIRSPNPYAPGVIQIQGNHSVGWARRQSAQLPQTIRASIELAQGVARSRAWEVFKAIVESRLKAAREAKGVFIESVHCDESLFSNNFTFTLNYRTYVDPGKSILTALSGLFASTGIGSLLELSTWEQWKESVAKLQSHRGQANLKHDVSQDQLIDLCTRGLNGSPPQYPEQPRTPLPLTLNKLYNTKPSPRDSYIKHKTYMGLKERTPTTSQTTIEKDDYRLNKFDPNKPIASLGETITGGSVKRYVESQAGTIEVVYMGYAERVGYPIPRPDKVDVGGVTLTRTGESNFRQIFLGDCLGQPVYAASWNQTYAMSERPSTLDGIDDWESV